jgi:glyoxylase-like metal-dependent hydrolase (beta-lactamase superfamily II)
MAPEPETRPAESPLPGGRDGATVRLHPLLSGRSVAPPAWVHAESGRLAALHAFGIGVSKSEFLRIPIVSFLVEHPSAGPILIDTGLHPSVAVDPKKNLGRLGARFLSGLEMDQDDAVPAQLRARGIQPSAVKLVVMTHLHFDHASAVSEFPEATFVFTRSEWDAATQPRAWLHGYQRRQFDHAFDYRLLDFEDPSVDSYATFGRSIDLLGDGSIRCLYTPGHTSGHMSMLLRLTTREALVAGDAIFTVRTLEEGLPPWSTEDMHLFRRSLKEIQLYWDTRPDALVIPGHDMEFWRTLDPVYE